MGINSIIRRSLTSAFLLGAALAAPVSAASVFFDLTTPGGFTAGTDGFGNYLEFTASDSVTKARVTGWSAHDLGGGILDIHRSTVRDYIDGIGVIAPTSAGFPGDTLGTAVVGNQHSIDNINTVDFIVFQFNTDLAPESVKLWPFISVPAPGQRGRDADAIFGYGDSASAWNSYTDYGSTATLASLFGGDYELINNADQPDGRTFNPVIDLLSPGSNGSLFLVGASPTNSDGNFDGFKVSHLTLGAAVPEPATWGMMLVGFGIVGAGMRSRRRSVVLA